VAALARLQTHPAAVVDGLELFFREAGQRGRPTVLLHGFLSSSHTFRDVVPRLADIAHVIAPDLPGFGLSSSPAVEELLAQVGIEHFFVYLHDFGAPVGYRLATRAPDRVRGLIVQSGNAHEDGLGEQWDSARRTGPSRPREARSAAGLAQLRRHATSTSPGCPSTCAGCIRPSPGISIGSA
jgi:pimeloyl-ACP methyl ester carboxylesterase